MIKGWFIIHLKMVTVTGNVTLFVFFLLVISCCISVSVIPVCSVDYLPIYLSFIDDSTSSFAFLTIILCFFLPDYR